MPDGADASRGQGLKGETEVCHVETIFGAVDPGPARWAPAVVRAEASGCPGVAEAGHHWPARLRDLADRPRTGPSRGPWHRRRSGADTAGGPLHAQARAAAHPAAC